VLAAAVRRRRFSGNTTDFSEAFSDYMVFLEPYNLRSYGYEDYMVQGAQEETLSGHGIFLNICSQPFGCSILRIAETVVADVRSEEQLSCLSFNLVLSILIPCSADCMADVCAEKHRI
jgi:hypothetical protein